MTSLCFMDGRLISMVLKDLQFDCLVSTPLLVFIEESDNGEIVDASAEMDQVELFPYMSVIRVITTSSSFRHSSLLFIDGVSGQLWWWNPRVKSPRTDFIDTVMKVVVHDFVKKQFEGIGTMTDLNGYVSDTSNPECDLSGLCNALVLKFLIDWMRHQPFDHSNIRDFAGSVIDHYGASLDMDEEEDVAYGFNSSGLLAGGLGGALIGGAIAGPGGALLGGTMGGLAGSSVRGFSMSDAKACSKY